MSLEESLATAEQQSPGLAEAFIENIALAVASVSIDETSARAAVSKL